MFSKRRLHDKYVSYRKLFSQNWTLFKASRIGLVGLGIMIAFLIVAAAVPFMGLRDPLYWLAPESDTIDVKEWWPLEVTPSSALFGKNASVEHAIAFRVRPTSSDARVDRIYIPEGNRLFAVQTTLGAMAWDREFVADSTISVDPLIVNYGHYVEPSESNYSVMIGTSGGYVYVMNDNLSNTNRPFALSRNLGSPITGLAAFSSNQLGGPVFDRDAFVVGTEGGFVYAFTVSRLDNISGRFFYHELWNTTLASPIHMAGAMIKSTASVPVASSAFYSSSKNESLNGQAVYVGTGDGHIVSLWMANGTVRNDTPIVRPPPLTLWMGAPVVLPAAEIQPATPTLVYAAALDYDPIANESTSKVWVRYADTLDPLESWVSPQYPDGGIPIVHRGVVSAGVSTPAVYGPAIFVTTDAGWLYRINRDPVKGRNDVITVEAGTVAWAYRDDSFRHDATHGTYFRSQPYIFQSLEFVIVAGNYNNGTADPGDDLGIIYVFNQAQKTEFASPSWKKTFSHAIFAMPTAWKDPLHVHEAVWFGTSRGDIYSYSTTGQYLAPLPPSWVRPTPYPSGNFYILGTDARGRDIFSQLLWGSRIALLVGFASAFFTIAIGVIIGLVAGFLGGRVESVLMRFTDVILVIPSLPLIIIMAAVLGAGIWNIILVISIIGWPGVARVIRAEVLSLKERPFIDSARVTGASNVRIMFRHIAPNVAPLAFLYMTFAVSGAILTEAALSFIGLGDVSTISWGIMLQDVSQSKALEAWWWLLPPGMAITLISLAFFLVGRAFDEIVNPRLRKR